jgi:hypothetical protein
MQRNYLPLFMASFFVFLLISASPIYSQDQTLGLFIYEEDAFDGYSMFSPLGSSNVYLIDMYGRVVHVWECEYPPGNSVYLYDDGSILRAARIGGPGSGGGRIQIYDWDGTKLWDFLYAGDDYYQHHDIEPMPNGNVLLLAWDHVSADTCIAHGRDPALIDGPELWPEKIVEVMPTGPTTGDIVWEWRTFDHVIQDFDNTKLNYGVVEDHPELMDFNWAIHGREDWLHGNSVQYTPVLDQICISLRTSSEIWVIDHSTTTEEAAGHTGGNSGMGGDILYRWGNPIVYRGGTAEDRMLWGQHDIRWIEEGLPGEGRMMVFNNGWERDEDFSTVDEFTSTVDGNGDYPVPPPGTAHGPSNVHWQYMANPSTDFFSGAISGAHRLPNNNTLICEGNPGRYFEVTSQKNIVWEYVLPLKRGVPQHQGDSAMQVATFRCTRIPADHPGLAGKDLTPTSIIELYPITYIGTMHSPSSPAYTETVTITTSIVYDHQPTDVDLSVDTGTGFWTVPMTYDGTGIDGEFLYSALVPPVSEGTKVTYYLNCIAAPDTTLNDPPNAPDILYKYTTGIAPVCGDANNDGACNVGDAVFLISYIFRDGSPPVRDCAADANGDDSINIGDGVYVISYIFRAGAPPVEPCCP